MLAAVLPVRRAIRMAPVDAIRTGYRAASTTRAGRLLRGLSLPGGALAQLPIRNLARSPRRSAMTILGLGAVLTAVVAVSGMVDSIRDVATRQEAATLTSSPRRLQVTLDGLAPRNSPAIRSVDAARRAWRGRNRASPVASTALAHGRSLEPSPSASSIRTRRSGIRRSPAAKSRRRRDPARSEGRQGPARVGRRADTAAPSRAGPRRHPAWRRRASSSWAYTAARYGRSPT